MSLLTKLRATIHAHELVKHGDTLVVGVSGGPDSLTLLHALRAISPDLSLNLHVAHLNHQLRGAESDADEQFVAQISRELGLSHAGARWDVQTYAEENKLSIEEAARNLRYQFLVGVATRVHANAIAVAHNADDQVETILLHFLRGAGLAGLRGMAYTTELATDDGRRTTTLIRPLLDITRAEIEEYCHENNLHPHSDSTNFDITILRNRLRLEVIPYLERINPNFRQVARHSALSIADDYAYIHQNIIGIFDRMARPTGDGFILDRKWFRALPINLQRGVLREAITRLKRIKNVGWVHIENARKVAAESQVGAEATLPRGLALVVGYDEFTIGEKMPLPDIPLLLEGNPVQLNVGDEVMLPESDWGVRVKEAGGSKQEADTSGLELDADKVKGNLTLRTRQTGERFVPSGMGGKHKSLHEFMINEKIPRHLRDFVPILADDEKILWVCGYRADGRAVVTPNTQKILRVEFFHE